MTAARARRDAGVSLRAATPWPARAVDLPRLTASHRFDVRLAWHEPCASVVGSLPLRPEVEARRRKALLAEVLAVAAGFAPRAPEAAAPAELDELALRVRSVAAGCGLGAARDGADALRLELPGEADHPVRARLARDDLLLERRIRAGAPAPERELLGRCLADAILRLHAATSLARVRVADPVRCSLVAEVRVPSDADEDELEAGLWAVVDLSRAAERGLRPLYHAEVAREYASLHGIGGAVPAIAEARARADEEDTR